jgi:hypothetical protein
MSDLTDYVVVVPGVASMVMGFLGFQLTNQIKRTDLLLELRKGHGEARFALPCATRPS